jgi:hypothetical protein
MGAGGRKSLQESKLVPMAQLNDSIEVKAGTRPERERLSANNALRAAGWPAVFVCYLSKKSPPGP